MTIKNADGMAYLLTIALLLLALMLSGVSSKRRRKSHKGWVTDSSEDFEQKRSSCRLSCRKPPGSLCVENSKGRCFCECMNMLRKQRWSPKASTKAT
uniref:Uncharacterized protein n=1 Tax=Rhipicephalus appendiculatus TaxID=34631 RepID=A0A131YCP7_RHIAP